MVLRWMLYLSTAWCSRLVGTECKWFTCCVVLVLLGRCEDMRLSRCVGIAGSEAMTLRRPIVLGAAEAIRLSRSSGEVQTHLLRRMLFGGGVGSEIIRRRWCRSCSPAGRSPL